MKKDSGEERDWDCFLPCPKGPPHCQELRHGGVACVCGFQAGRYRSGSPEWGQLDLGSDCGVQPSPASLWGLLEVGGWEVANSPKGRSPKEAAGNCAEGTEL